MERILVTGGLGFIGSNFILHLLASEPELEIANLDKMTYAGNPMNLARITGDPRYTFVRGDVTDEGLVAGLLGANAFDGIVHLAAESFVDRSIESAAPFVHSNVAGTQVLLDAALKYGVPRFVYVSTDEVYGSLGKLGTFTEQSPIEPNNPYSATKAAAGMLCRAYHRTHGLPVTITRCSNNYGARQFPEKLIPLMIKKALSDERLPIYGDGLHVRDWLYVEDHCRALHTVLTRGEPGEVYNIGGGTEMPNLDLVKLLLRRLDKPESLIEFVADRPGHDRRYAIDSSKIKRELGWEAKTSFEEGLERTIAWYLDNPGWLEAIANGTYQDMPDNEG